MSLCKEKGERIGMAPDRLAGTAVDSVISWKSWSLTFFALDIFAWCCHCLLIWLALVIVESWQIFWLPACCLDVFFLPDISLSLSTSFSDDHFLSIRFALVIFESWQPLSFWQLRSLLSFLLTFLSLLSSPPTLFTAFFLLFPTFFSSLLSSRLSSTIYSSSPLYRLHLYCPDTATLFTSLPSSHRYSLAISTFFTSLRSSLLYFLHISTFFTSLLSTSLHSWHLIFTSLPYRPCNRV